MSSPDSRPTRRRPGASVLAGVLVVAVLLPVHRAAAGPAAPVEAAGPVVVDDVAGGPAGESVLRPAPRAHPPAVSRIVVRWKASASLSGREAARRAAETWSPSGLGRGNFEVVRLRPGAEVRDALRVLRADPRVAVAEPDRYLTNFATPNDPDLPLQWSLNNSAAPIQGFSNAKPGGDVDAFAAWTRTTGSARTVVAVLDGGYDFLSPDLAPVVWTNPGETAGNGVDDDGNGRIDDVHGWDFVGSDVTRPVEDPDPTDDDAVTGGHGMHVAGILGAEGNNRHGIVGIAPDVRLMPLRVCAAAPTGDNTCSLSAIVAAINYAGAMGVRVANLSLGGPVFSQVMADAFAANPRTLFVVAAGNSGRDNQKHPVYPCAVNPAADSNVPGRVDNVLCVAASDQRDQRASFSNWGARSVDLAAPGVRIWSLFRTGPVWRDDFSANDFGRRWTATTGGFGRAGAGDGKLTSAGLTDSPGRAPAAGTRQVVSVAQRIPANIRSCKVEGERWVKRGPGGTLGYAVLADGEPVVTAEVADTTIGVMQSFSSAAFDAATIAGRSVSLQFTYAAPPGLDASHGVWLDDLRIFCARSPDQPALYDYLEGTSMAAPLVSGSAALLFALKPTSSVAAVRKALLGSVEKLEAWRSITVSGGRLNTAAALGRLVPPDTRFVSPVAVSGQSATLDIAQVGAVPSVRFQCRLDSGSWVGCNPRGILRGLHPGRHVLTSRAVDAYRNVDPSPVSSSFAIPGCLVPRVTGTGLKRARALIVRGGCTVGAVRRPAGVPIAQLVVRSTSPRAGTYLPTDGAPVKLWLVRR